MAGEGGGLIRFGRRAADVAGPRPSGEELLSALPVALLVIDGDGMVRDATVAAEAMVNLGRNALIGRPIREAIGHPLTSIASDQPFIAYDLDVTLPGDRPLRVDLTAAPLPDRPGWRVVTLHGRAHASLLARRGERHGAAMSAAAAAAMLAHEIKNPLSGIRGAAQLIEGADPDTARAMTGLIRDEVDRITRLLDRMEGFTDTRPRAIQPQNIHAILGHVREVAGTGFARDVPIREVYDPSLPPVLGNRDSLVQLFLNLVKNAAEAIGQGGTITLTTAYRHGLSMARHDSAERRSLPIEVCVIDDGPGAPAEIVDHLFDAFVTGRASGSGLGLAMVEKLVNDQGGIVEYGREGTPTRTVLRVLLPRAPRG